MTPQSNATGPTCEGLGQVSCRRQVSWPGVVGPPASAVQSVLPGPSSRGLTSSLPVSLNPAWPAAQASFRLDPPLFYLLINSSLIPFNPPSLPDPLVGGVDALSFKPIRTQEQRRKEEEGMQATYTASAVVRLLCSCVVVRLSPY